MGHMQSTSMNAAHLVEVEHEVELAYVLERAI